MALVKIGGSTAPGPTVTIGTGGNEDNTYVFGDASDGFVGTLAIQIFERVAGTATFTVQARSRMVPTGQATPAFQPIPYLALSLGGVAQAGGTYATAALAADALILVQATGLDIALDVNWTDGEWDIYVSRVEGAAA